MLGFREGWDFSRRSTYKALVHDERSRGTETSATTSDLWSIIWGAEVLARVKLFAWRACMEALPTKCGLHVRIPSIGEQCGVCGAAKETGLHVLHQCGLARSIWELSSLASVTPDGCGRLVEWWGCYLKKLEDEDVTVFLTLCWAIWGARCLLVMEGECGTPESILAYGLKMAKNAKETVADRGGGATQRVNGDPTSWVHPKLGWYKINVDAGFLGEWGSRLGLVCRAASGEVVGFATVQQEAHWEVQVAEAKAVLAGVQWGLQLGVSNLVLESDCLVVVQALRNGVVGSSEFFLIIEDIIALSSSFNSVVWSFVKRTGNKVAHHLTHFQPFVSGWRRWVDNILDSVLNIVVCDLIE